MFHAPPRRAAVSAALESASVLVIDAGHGGTDGGAVAADGTVESGINLAIALRMKAVAGLLGLPGVLTRSAEALDYPESASTTHAKKVWDQQQRVALINALPNAVLVSIHQNKYPDARPRGAQALYGREEGSEVLAALMQDALTRCLCPDNRRVAAPISDSIYLMKSVRCPAVLVECGFLSNPEELARLKTPDCQTQLALVLAASYLQFLGAEV